MAFDDLAKHMAARDGKKKLASPPGDVDQILAAAAAADRRMNRTRDLVLGPLLLIGGLAVGILVWSVRAAGGLDRQMFQFALAGSAFALAAIGLGARKTLRGLRDRSIDDTGETEALTRAVERRPPAR